MTVLSCTDLDAGYDGVPVVRKMNLSVEAGEVVALLGPNGAGKTSLLLTFSGILRPLGGSIGLLGRAAGGVAPEKLARLGLAHVPDDRALFGDLSTIDNLRISARSGGITEEEVFDMFPSLHKRRHLAAMQLSGGEQQMLTLSRALMQNPQVLMVDEMSMGLAPTVVQSLLPVLRRVADERGVGVLMVEQHVHMAMAIADRAYVLNHGSLVLEGDARALRAAPERLEAAYLGRTSVG